VQIGGLKVHLKLSGFSSRVTRNSAGWTQELLPSLCRFSHVWYVCVCVYVRECETPLGWRGVRQKERERDRACARARSRKQARKQASERECTSGEREIVCVYVLFLHLL